MVLLRLADRQGLLKGSNISRFQQWALAYLIVEERRERYDEIYDIQEFLFSIIDPERHRAVMGPKQQASDLFEGESYAGPDDFAELERWIQDLEKPKKILSKDLV